MSGYNGANGNGVREKGTVKWFNAEKGYGFIQRHTGEDVFVHHSAIQMPGYRDLQNGIIVEFDIKKGPKGLCAENVSKKDIQTAPTPKTTPNRHASPTRTYGGNFGWS